MIVLLVAPCALCLFGLLALQLTWVRQLALSYRLTGSQLPPSPDGHARVILCLRGADPGLPECLEALSRQTYTNWDLRVVLDHEDDPAARIIANYENAHPNIHVSVMQQRLGTCSLKLNALAEELTSLPEDCQFVVLVDADVVTYSTWLQDMVTPLTSPEFGAATGVRWFDPAQANLGSSVRYLWNVGAIPQMHRFGIPWGGSLAIRADVIRSANLSQRWSRMVFEDADLNNVLQEQNLRLAVVASATLVNVETTSFRDAVRYIRRQMLNARMYHSHWWRMFTFGAFSSLLPVALFFLSIASYRAGEAAAFLIATMGLAGYAAGMAGSGDRHSPNRCSANTGTWDTGVFTDILATDCWPDYTTGVLLLSPPCYPTANSGLARDRVFMGKRPV